MIGQRQLYAGKFRNLHSSPNNIRMIESRKVRWAGHVARMGEINAYQTLAGKLEGQRPLWRPRRKGKYNIKVYCIVKESVCGLDSSWS
jgi:hypothetical protein